MRNIKEVILCVTLIFIFTKCGESFNKSEIEFTENSNLTDLEGTRIDSSVYYFPEDVFIDSVGLSDGWHIKIDYSALKNFSDILYEFDEPVLYNYYLNKDVYRFTWIRSFHPTIVIKIEKHNDFINIIEKKRLEYFSEVKSDDGFSSYYMRDSLQIIQKNKNINESVLRELKMIISSNFFYKMPPTVSYEFGTDGSEWILETHTVNGYYVVNRWSPNKDRYSKFRKICEHLINISSFNDQEIY